MKSCILFFCTLGAFAGDPENGDLCFGNFSSFTCTSASRRTQRWTFDIKNETCVNITTCPSNQTVFPTQLECKAACKNYTLCYVPRAVTGCSPESSDLPKRTWHFDSKTERCVQDTNSANIRNNFASKRDCRKECPYGGIGHFCIIEKDSGQYCKRSKPSKRWYWDKRRGGCRSFIYKGCKGNSNNFYSNVSCAAICKPDN